MGEWLKDVSRIDTRSVTVSVSDPDDAAELASAIRHEIRRRLRRAGRERTLNLSRAPTQKRCPTCSTTRAAEDFGPNSARPDGLQSICRLCRIGGE